MATRVLATLLVAHLAISAVCAAAEGLTLVGGHLLKPSAPGEGGAKRVATMFIYDDRLKFVIAKEPVPLKVSGSDIKGIQYQSGQRRASVGTMVAWGVLGAIAGKRTMTTVGIEKTDGEIIVFQWKGKDTMHVTMKLDQFMARLEEGRPAPGNAALGTCDIGQVAAMARAGLTDDQIEAACGEGGGSP